MDGRAGGAGRGRDAPNVVGGCILIEDDSSSSSSCGLLLAGDVGIKVTGGSIDRLESGCGATLREGDGSGPVFEGDSDLARSSERPPSVFVYKW